MMPAQYVFLDALPFTANGKVNRQALPKPEPTTSASSKQFVAPERPSELQLAALWSNIVHIEQVGRSDTFFQTGGDSIMATQLIVQVRETFGVELPLRLLFEGATLASLAEQIEALQTFRKGPQQEAMDDKEEGEL